MFLGSFGLPGRDFSFQNSLKARRCHPIKVSGLTITKADFQSSQSLDQKTRLRRAASVNRLGRMRLVWRRENWETGQRPLSPELARKMVRVYKLSPSSLPPSRPSVSDWRVSPDQLAADLAGLGYPGFAYPGSRRRHKNPGELLLTALAQEQLEARLFEALPWLMLKYWDMNKEWLVRQAKLHDLQNRLGFVVSLARKAGSRSPSRNPKRDAVLEELESKLKRSLLAKEELLGGTDLSDAERKRLKRHRPKAAREWNVLSSWRPEVLRYVA